jgi:hypothetical protein
MEVRVQHHALATVPSEKTVHIRWEAGCGAEPVWTFRKGEESLVRAGI